MLAFPMPNEKLFDRTVVASCWYTDEIALVLLMGLIPPYFMVVHYYMADVAADVGVPARAVGALHFLGEFYNIVTAVQLYEESGGDY